MFKNIFAVRLFYLQRGIYSFGVFTQLLLVKIQFPIKPEIERMLSFGLYFVGKSGMRKITILIKKLKFGG